MQISGGMDAEFVWRCQLRQLLVKASAVMLGIVSAAIVMAEATLLFEADLSLFSAIVGMVGDSEMLVQVILWFTVLVFLSVLQLWYDGFSSVSECSAKNESLDLWR